MTKIAGSGSISQRHGSADPDPNQNVMDPEHCHKGILLYNIHCVTCVFMIISWAIKAYYCVSVSTSLWNSVMLKCTFPIVLVYQNAIRKNYGSVKSCRKIAQKKI